MKKSDNVPNPYLFGTSSCYT